MRSQNARTFQRSALLSIVLLGAALVVLDCTSSGATGSENRATAGGEGGAMTTAATTASGSGTAQVTATGTTAVSAPLPIGGAGAGPPGSPTTGSANSSAGRATSADPRKRDAVEVVLSISGRQVYALHRFGDWLYLNGSIGGPATRRLQKDEVGLSAEGLIVAGSIDDRIPIVGPWSGSTIANVFYSDETHVYWLDHNSIYRQGLDDVVQSVDLGDRYYVLGGDTDTVFVASDSCMSIVLMDKATLALRVFTPEGLTAEGGSLEVGSDGSKVYCAGHRDTSPIDTTNIEMLHSIDKATGELARIDVSGTGLSSPGGGPAPISSMFFHEGTLYAKTYGNFWFGTLAVETGVFSGLVETVGMGYSPSRIHRDKSTGLFYWATQNTMVRYDVMSNTLEPLVELISGSMGSGTTLDNEYLFWKQERRTDDGLVDGIVRLKKPPPP